MRCGVCRAKSWESGRPFKPPLVGMVFVTGNNDVGYEPFEFHEAKRSSSEEHEVRRARHGAKRSSHGEQRVDWWLHSPYGQSDRVRFVVRPFDRGAIKCRRGHELPISVERLRRKLSQVADGTIHLEGS